MWPFKNTPEADVQPTKIRRVCILNVQLSNGWLSWTERNVTDAAHPWHDFIDWFHEKPDSATFQLVEDDGDATGLVRKEIRQYQIKYRMEEFNG